MSWTPTDEQALAVKAELGTHGVECTGPGEVTCRCREGGWMSWSAFNEHQARAVLVAVGPMIAARALRDADSALTALSNPYIPPAWLSARAYQIEKEAGR